MFLLIQIIYGNSSGKAMFSLTGYYIKKQNTVCPQSRFVVFKNCAPQMKIAKHMRFAAAHSETLEVLFCRQ
jgi:hypothetical protein